VVIDNDTGTWYKLVTVQSWRSISCTSNLAIFSAVSYGGAGRDIGFRMTRSLCRVTNVVWFVGPQTKTTNKKTKKRRVSRCSTTPKSRLSRRNSVDIISRRRSQHLGPSVGLLTERIVGRAARVTPLFVLSRLSRRRCSGLQRASVLVPWVWT